MSDVPNSPGNEVRESGQEKIWNGFSRTWAKGLHEVYVIRLVRGLSGPDKEVLASSKMISRWLTFSFGLPLSTLVLLGLPDLDFAGANPIIFIFLGVINAGMFGAASTAWRYALKRTTSLDDLLRPCQSREKIVAVVERALVARWQAPPVILFGLLPMAAASIELGLTSFTSWRTLLLLLNFAWSLAILGNVSYWLVVSPWLVIRLSACTDIALRWNDPARTPGIRTFSEGYAYSAFFLVLAALGVTLPGIFGFSIFGKYLTFIYALLLALSMWVAVITHISIYVTVRRFKLAVLDELSSSGKFLTTTRQTKDVVQQAARLPSMAANLSAYDAIVASPGLPYGTSLIVQYAAAVVGSIAGILLQ